MTVTRSLALFTFVRELGATRGVDRRVGLAELDLAGHLADVVFPGNGVCFDFALEVAAERWVTARLVEQLRGAQLRAQLPSSRSPLPLARRCWCAPRTC